MSEVVHDPEALKESYTPKQHENFESHVQPLLDKLDKLPELAAKNDGDVERAEEWAERGKKWFLRTYRPKKRGDGVMERDHVKIGQPEHYFKKMLGKFGNPWSSIEGLMMASFGVSGDLQDEIDDAAAAVFMARNLGNKRKLAETLEEHERVGKLYGV